MIIYDGSVQDTKNFSSDKYLQVNSCGYQNVTSDYYTMIRRKGRVDYHILLVACGSGHVRHNGRVSTLTRGSLVIYEPNEEQEYSFAPGTTTMYVHFCGRIVPEIFAELALSGGSLDAAEDRSICDSFAELIRNFHCEERVKFSNSALLELLYNISELQAEHRSNKYDELIMPVLAYINENYNKKITLSELAERIGYSKSRFSHIFSEVTGTSPLRYQNEIRLKAACEFLQSTELSVTSIAGLCGFDDPLYFFRIFKKKYSMTPCEFRERSNG